MQLNGARGYIIIRCPTQWGMGKKQFNILFSKDKN
jgi:hypothetical protein